jgi:hypothetical protein
MASENEVIAGWTMCADRGLAGLLGNRHPEPVVRPKSDAERALASYLNLTAAAPTPEECRSHLDHALSIARQQGLTLAPPPPPPWADGTSRHFARMDAARIVITGVLVLGVLVIILLALRDKDPAAASQFAAPVSGLAGICLGWLFTNQRSAKPPDASNNS